MDKNELQAQIFTDEIKQAFDDLKDQKTQLISIVRIYLIVLAGLLVYASYVNREYRFSDPPTLPVVLGVAFAAVAFLIGWLIVVFTGHSICRQLQARKHIAYMRGKLLKLAKDDTKNESLIGFLPFGSDQERLTRKDSVSNIVFASSNLVVLTFSIVFFQMIHPQLIFWIGVLFVHFLIAWIYSGNCAAYASRIQIATFAQSADEIYLKEDERDRFRKEWIKSRKSVRMILSGLGIVALIIYLAMVLHAPFRAILGEDSSLLWYLLVIGCIIQWYRIQDLLNRYRALKEQFAGGREQQLPQASKPEG